MATEHFVVFILDVRNRVLGYTVAGQGGIDTCPVDPRAVFRSAVIIGASAIIVAHNHPSGDPTPSVEDRTVTERLRKAGELLGIQVLDHVVLGEDRYFSFADESYHGIGGAS